MLIEEIKRQYSVQAAITTNNTQSALEQPHYIVNLKGPDSARVQRVCEALQSFLKIGTIVTKLFDAEAGNWKSNFSSYFFSLGYSRHILYEIISDKCHIERILSELPCC